MKVHKKFHQKIENEFYDLTEVMLGMQKNINPNNISIIDDGSYFGNQNDIGE